MRILFQLIVCLFLSLPLQAAEQGPTNNVISMPWDAFMQLWVSARKEEPPEPKAAYGKILYLGEVEKNGDDYLIRVTAKMGVTLFSAQETLTPLFPEAITLESLEIDEKETPWTTKDGYTAAFLRGAGDHEVEATFTLKPEINGVTRKLKIPFLGQARQEIVLLVPETNIQSYVDYGVALETIDRDDEGAQIHAYFKAMNEVTLIWYELHAKTTETQVPQSELSLKTFLHAGDEGVDARILAHLDILEGWVENLNLLIPENLLIEEIKGAQGDLKWVIQNSEQPGFKKLVVLFPNVLTGSQDINFKGFMPGIAGTYTNTWNLPRAEGIFEKNSRLFLGVASGKSIEVLRIQDLEEATLDKNQVSPQEGYLTQAYIINGADPQIDLTIKGSALMKPFEIKSAAVFTTLNAASPMLTKVVVTIKNIKAQFLPLRLAEGAKLLETKVNGVVVDVMQDQQYLIPIPTSPSFEVSLIYDQGARLGQFDFLKYSLPDFGFPVENMVWHIGSQQDNNFFVGLLAPRLSSADTSLNPDLKQGVWKSFQLNSAKNIPVLFLGSKVSRVGVLMLAVLLALYIFWTLTFFLERAYLPEVLYETRVFILGTVVSLVLVVLLAFFDPTQLGPLVYSLVGALVLFALWQNRLVSNRFKILFQKRYRFAPPLALILFLSASAATLIILAPFWSLFPPLVLIALHMAFLKTYPKLVEKKARAKVLPHLVLICLLLGSGTVLAQEEVQLKTGNELKEGHVYMEWSLIEDLLNKIEGKEKERQKTAGLKYVFGSAKVTGDVADTFAQIRIETPVEILSQQWVLVPVVHENQIVTEVSLDGEMVPLRREGNKIYLQNIRGKNNISKLEVELLIPVEAGFFRTESDLLKGANINLSFEGDMKNVTLSHALWQKKEASVLKAALDTSGIFELSLGKESAPTPASIVPAVERNIRTQMIVRVERDHLLVKANLFISAGGETLSNLRLQLPEDVELQRVESDNVRIWAKESPSQYRIDFKTPVSTTTEISLVYQRKLDFDAGEIIVPELTAVNLAQEGYLALVMDSLSEIQISSVKGLRRVLEAPMALDKPALHVFKYANGSYELKLLRGVVMPPVESFPSIKEAVWALDWQPDHWKVVLDFQGIELGGNDEFGFVLPKGARVNLATIDGQETKVTLGQKGGLAIKIDESLRPQNIHLEYLWPKSLSGLTRLPLPSIAATMDQVTWSLELQKTTTLLPLKETLSVAPKDYFNLLGFKYGQNEQALVHHEGPLAPNAQFRWAFYEGPRALIWSVFILIFIGLAFFTSLIPALFMEGRKRQAVLMVIVLSAFLLVAPFPWFYLLASLGLGLFIRLLWRRLKNDNAIIV